MLYGERNVEIRVLSVNRQKKFALRATGHLQIWQKMEKKKKKKSNLKQFTVWYQPWMSVQKQANLFAFYQKAKRTIEEIFQDRDERGDVCSIHCAGNCQHVV